MNWITLQLYKIAIHLRIKASYLIQGVLYKGIANTSLYRESIQLEERDFSPNFYYKYSSPTKFFF